MKFITVIVITCFINTVLFAQEQKIISDCTITYSVNSLQENNIGSKTIYIKGKDIRIDLVSKTFQQTTFYNGTNGDATVLKTVGESKYISNYKSPEWKKANEIYEGIKVSFTGKAKQVLNHNCREAILTFKNGNSYTVYYDPALVPSVMENPFEFKNIPGLVLEYESSPKENEKITYTASKIDFTPVPSYQFEIPKSGHRVLH